MRKPAARRPGAGAAAGAAASAAAALLLIAALCNAPAPARAQDDPATSTALPAPADAPAAATAAAEAAAAAGAAPAAPAGHAAPASARPAGVAAAAAVAAGAVSAAYDPKGAAVSSYLYPQWSGLADVRIREARVPSKTTYGPGFTNNTYWCTLGYWTNGKTSGYGGMQLSTDRTMGPTNYIYSQWNDYTTVEYAHPLTKATTFGGEGTGVKSYNKDLPWKPDVWHVNADRVYWRDGRSLFAFFVRDGSTGVWTHLITWSTPEAGLLFNDGYTFIEDWTGDGVYREGHIRRGWMRANATRAWNPLTQYGYQINDYDVTPAGRSYNKRTNWRGGVASDSTGSYFFMGAGGNAKCSNNSGKVLSIPRTSKQPSDEYGVMQIASAAAKVDAASGNLTVTWSQVNTTVPQFWYRVQILNSTKAVRAEASGQVPQQRSASFNLKTLLGAAKRLTYTASVDARDMFDGAAAAKSVTFIW